MARPDPMQIRRDYASVPVRDAAVAPGSGNVLAVLYITEDDGSGNNTDFSKPNDNTVTCNTKPDGTGDSVSVDIRTANGVWFTGERIIAVRISDPETETIHWEMACNGVSQWIGTAMEDIATSGTVELTYDKTYPAAAQETCEVEATNLDSTFNIAVSADVLVHFEQATGLFYILATTCPPSE